MKKFFIFFIFTLLAVSLVSASWFSNLFNGGITGNVIDDNTVLPDSANPYCADTDLGVKATEAGVVFVRGRVSNYLDKCSGKAVAFTTSAGVVRGYSQIVETYCQNGKKTQTMNSSQLGRGYCKSETINVEGTPYLSAKWVSVLSTCVVVAGGVKDENGKIYRTGCLGNSFRTYTCNVSAVQYSDENCSTSDGFGKCTAVGCTGRCTAAASDPGNNKDVGGVVTFNGKLNPDTCSPDRKSVRQYKCSQGRLVIIPTGKHGPGWTSCGANRECIENNVTGSYCREKYAGAATLESLQTKVTDLQSQIDALTARIDALEDDTATVSENFGRTDCAESNQWCDGADVNNDGTVDGSDLSVTLSE